jgi:hypothetical protein
MANVDMFNSGIDVPMTSEVFTLGGMNSPSPSLNFSNYSNLIPFGNQNTGLNFEPGGYDMPSMFPEEMPTEMPADNSFPTQQQGDMFPEMFPAEVQPQSFGNVNQNYSQPFEPDFSNGDMLQFSKQNPNFEMMSLDATQFDQNQSQRDPVIDFIDKTPLPNTPTGVSENQQNKFATEQQTEQTLNQSDVSRNAVNIPGSVRNKDTKTPIKASAGYEGDISNFFEEIKNPPMWRVLG